MLSLSRAAGCAAILLSFGFAQAQAPKKLPVAVQKELAEMMKTCRDVGGKPMKSPDLLLVADLTGDGLPDYVIDQASFSCEGAASLFSGSGGSQISAYVGTPDGQAFQAFSSGSFGVKIDKEDKPARLHLVVGGQLCGQRVSANMARSDYKSCWRPVNWNARNRKLEFAPVSQVKFIQ
jgi:hypothetical protein